jgi:hypothetical protein
MKELLAQVFGVPKNNRKSKPFVDHVLSFTMADNRVWIRNYQIVLPSNKKGNQALDGMNLVEVTYYYSTSLLSSDGMNPVEEAPDLYNVTHYISLDQIVVTRAMKSSCADTSEGALGDHICKYALEEVYSDYQNNPHETLALVNVTIKILFGSEQFCGQCS